MDLRRRAGLELAVLAVAASAFLVLVPVRPVLVDLGLAALGLAFVALGRHETRRRVWGDAPPRDARRRAGRVLAAATVAASLLMVAAGFFLGRAADAMLGTSFLATVALLAPWAWLQQAIFQFYLLGRLRLLLRGAGEVAVAGIGGVLFAAVHAPEWERPTFPRCVVRTSCGDGSRSSGERGGDLSPGAPPPHPRVHHLLLGGVSLLVPVHEYGQ
jgi:hypothetical protein